MLIETRCPRCRTAREVPEAWQGRVVRCEACRQLFEVEDGRTTTAPPAPAAAPPAVPVPDGAIQGSHRPVPPPARRRRADADDPTPLPRRPDGRGVSALVAFVVVTAAVAALATGGLAVRWVFAHPAPAPDETAAEPADPVPPPVDPAGPARVAAGPPATGPDLAVPLRYRWDGGGTHVFAVRVEADTNDFREVWEGNYAFTVVPDQAAEGFTVTARGSLSGTREARPRGPLPAGPPAPVEPEAGPPREERDEVVMDASGLVLKRAGGLALPFLLGDVAGPLIDPLPAPGEKSREAADTCTLVGPQGNALPAAPPGLAGFGPPGAARPRVARATPTAPPPGPAGLPPATYSANERTVCTRGPKLGDAVLLQRRYELESEPVPGRPPRVRLSGEGPVRFDVTAGMPTALEFRGTLTLTTGDLPARIPLVLTYRLLGGAEGERALQAPDQP